ncbi:uncharacterized protein [Aegilops tauschii subsp. strangulata]|uniref:uncharacterized protein n=1 Tax=Aegilops tauschii subsp. strangulata TaxID=200361 RepID=UPI003CC8569B
MSWPSSPGSSMTHSSNPFAGPEPSAAAIRDLNIEARVPIRLDSSSTSYYAWKTYFNLVLHGSKDIFHTVVAEDDDAYTVWGKINTLFTDNKLQRLVFLQQEFFGCHQDNSTIDEYCTRLKMLADELRDIGAKVSDDLMLSTLTAGLNEDFGNAASNLTLLPQPTFQRVIVYLKLEERRMTKLTSTPTSPPVPPTAALLLRPPPVHPRPPATTRCRPRPPRLPSSRKVAGAGVTGGVAEAAASSSRSSSRRQVQGAPRFPQPPLPWAAGYNPWTGVVHAYHMPVPRAPAPGLLGPRPAGHQAFVGTTYQPYGAPLAPPPLGGYSAPAQAPPYGGQLPPPTPAPWDPALLAALQSAPSPSNYGGGGDWYMDSGATAHMTAHPGCPYPDGASPM